MVSNLFIFRRDIRLEDNIGINYILESGNVKNVIPIFIFTPEQVGSKNRYRSENAISFMMESLEELDKALKKIGSKLHVFYGENDVVLRSIIDKLGDVERVIYNIDYTPYARARDESIRKLCEKKGVEVVELEDYLLYPIGDLLKRNGEPYSVFTPFKNLGLKFSPKKPKILSIKRGIFIKKVGLGSKMGKYGGKGSVGRLVRGGRRFALGLLGDVGTTQKAYNKTRNDLERNTTRLSASIKFGCVSIREVYWTFVGLFGKNCGLVSQLYWREFYFYVAYYRPEVISKSFNYNKRYDGIKWRKSKKDFDAWTRGETGYPVVDAGMRELLETGYMHNRARLITSNFMNRILGMDWRLGERYFAEKLTDYDPVVNNGNWQWIASTGVDPKPYFQRLFNPWIQSKKFDKDAKYIKKWIPELENVPAKDIHNWETTYADHPNVKYPKPIANYKEARKRSQEMYRRVLK